MVSKLMIAYATPSHGESVTDAHTHGLFPPLRRRGYIREGCSIGVHEFHHTTIQHVGSLEGLELLDIYVTWISDSCAPLKVGTPSNLPPRDRMGAPELRPLCAAYCDMSDGYGCALLDQSCLLICGYVRLIG